MAQRTSGAKSRTTPEKDRAGCEAGERDPWKPAETLEPQPQAERRADGDLGWREYDVGDGRDRDAGRGDHEGEKHRRQDEGIDEPEPGRSPGDQQRGGQHGKEDREVVGDEPVRRHGAVRRVARQAQPERDQRDHDRDPKRVDKRHRLFVAGDLACQRRHLGQSRRKAAKERARAVDARHSAAGHGDESPREIGQEGDQKHDRRHPEKDVEDRGVEQRADRKATAICPARRTSRPPGIAAHMLATSAPPRHATEDQGERQAEGAKRKRPERCGQRCRCDECERAKRAHLRQTIKAPPFTCSVCPVT